jgi:hypothetical protein
LSAPAMKATDPYVNRSAVCVRAIRMFVIRDLRSNGVAYLRRVTGIFLCNAAAIRDSVLR